MFIVYRNIEDFLLNEKEEKALNIFTGQPQYRDNEEYKKDNQNLIINSNIISFKMNDRDEIDYLKNEPIELTFKHLLTNENQLDDFILTPVCAYWNYDKEYKYIYN